MTDQTSTTLSEPPVRRLYRSKTDRVIGGVCGGIAEYFRVDPVLVRVAAVALVIAGGAGLLLYLAALALIPVEGAEPRGRGLTIVGVALIALAVGGLFSFHGGGLFVLPLVLLGAAGLFAWRLATGDRPDGDSRSLLRAAGLGALLLVGCLALALGSGWAAAVGGGAVVGTAVILAGVLCVAGAVMGRNTRWLILPALAIAIPAGFVAAAGIDGHGGVGEKIYRPATATELLPSYRVGLGHLELDLRHTQLPPGDHPVKLKAGVGLAELIVPRGVCVTTRAHMGAGGVQVFDRSSGGVDVDWQDGRTAKPGVARIVLDGNVGVGAVMVTDRPGHNSHIGNLGCA